MTGYEKDSKERKYLRPNSTRITQRGVEKLGKKAGKRRGPFQNRTSKISLAPGKPKYKKASMGISQAIE